MAMDVIGIAEAVGGVATAVGSIYAGAKTIIASSRRKKEAHKQEILKQAAEEMYKIKAELESKIKDLQVELEATKENISRDMSHMREVYNAEIRVLGGKIDDLRNDLSDQHQSMVNLLTKLVNSR